MTLRFGKYRGRDLEDVPLSYLAWLLEQARSLDPALRRAIRIAIAARIGATLDHGAQRMLPAPEIAEAAHEIVDNGFRVAAKRAHPDTGGDHRQMIAVSNARDYLRRAVDHGVAA